MKPMLAAKAALSEPPTGPGRLFEPKLDGIRAHAGRVGGQPFITSREGADITHAFPEVLSLLLALPWADVTLDGEIVGRDLSAVAWRVNLARPGELAVRRAPCRLMAFDLLVAGGIDLCAGPLWSRKDLLLSAMRAAGHPEAHVPHTDDGAALWAQARAEGWEGIMAKRADSIYRPGVRSADWLKVKVSAANRAA